MLIGIDGNEANIENKVGVNVYAYELLWSIYKLQDTWKDRLRFEIFLKEAPKDLPEERPYWEYKVLKGGSFWIFRKLTPYLLFAKNKPDVFFSPSHYLPPLSTMTKVCSIMDLGYLKFSGQFRKRDYWQLRFWSAWSIIISKYIITISNSSKQQIVRHYRFARKKVFVTHLSYDKERFNTRISLFDVRRVKNKFTIGDQYILFLGTLKPGKNVEGLLDAWFLIEKEFPKTKLVIAGKKGWFFESIFKKVNNLNLDDRVIFTGFVDEQDKPALISGARVFVLPSFWEGFGLDVLSSFACGVTVVASNRGSLPEVCGNAALLVDPGDPKDIAEKVKKVLEMDDNEYNKMVKQGLSQAKKFSWEKTALKTLKILERR